MILKSVAFENFFQIQLKLYWKDVQIWCRRDSAIFILNPTSNWIWGLISRINFKYKLLCEIDEDVIIQNMIKPSQIFASIIIVAKHDKHVQSSPNSFLSIPIFHTSGKQLQPMKSVIYSDVFYIWRSTHVFSSNMPH